MKKFNLIYGGFCIFALGVVACAAEPNEQTNKKEVISMEERAKRRAPKPVEPVEINNVRYEVVRAAKARGLGHDGGVIAAVDVASGKELWTLDVYQTVYDQNEEQDVQEVYITKLGPGEDHDTLQIENEAHKAFSVNLNTREVLDITKK